MRSLPYQIGLYALALASINICWSMQPKKDILKDTSFISSIINTETGYYKNIRAELPSDSYVGYIEYEPKDSDPTCWRIIRTIVYSEYRENGIGRNLLHRCIDDIQEQKARKLSWAVIPWGPYPLSTEELLDVYKRMLGKIDNSFLAKIIVKERENGRSPKMTLNLE